MIISASRRTDIPAFYSQWLIERIRAQYCTVINPFNSKQVVYVSLHPADVDAIVFWSKNPAPLLPYLQELDRRGYRYYFQITITGYGRLLEPHVPDVNEVLSTFDKLSMSLGADRVIWRYDPIIFSSATNVDFHRRNFSYLAQRLAGKTRRVVISFVDSYQKVVKELKKTGIIVDFDMTPLEDALNRPAYQDLLLSLRAEAEKHGMEIQSCAEAFDLSPYGIRPGKCIDDGLIARVFGIDVNHTKDKTQRPECNCVQSRDIGVYNTCLHGCRYCYATRSLDAASKKSRLHNPYSPSLVGNFNAELPKVRFPEQLALFQHREH